MLKQLLEELQWQLHMGGGFMELDLFIRKRKGMFLSQRCLKMKEKGERRCGCRQ